MVHNETTANSGPLATIGPVLEADSNLGSG